MRSERDIISDAYTLTYSTVDRTLAAPTAVAIGDLNAVQNTGWGATAEADFDKIATNLDKLVADNLDLRKALAALITDLKAQGVLQ